jgi:hypothetical protein
MSLEAERLANYDQLLMVVSGLALVVSSLATILIRLLSSRFTAVEDSLKEMKAELVLLDKTVASGYVPRLEMDAQITRVLSMMREDRHEILAALKEIGSALSNTVKREECIRLHENGRT